MNKRLRVLHLASFNGNIGDNANHLGARNLFNRYLKVEFKVTEIEIREFYRKRRKFDDNFIEEINSYDLFIIGGGNYFELWPENTKSGTSIDFGVEDLRKLKTPTIFFALGVDIGQGVSEINKNKFSEFLKFLFSKREQFFVSVRNDGALENLVSLYGEEIREKVSMIPDGGFFSANSFIETQLFTKTSALFVGINLAGDMLDKRFKQGKEEFIKEFSEVLNSLLNKRQEIQLVFFNHIPKDLILSSEIINRLEDNFARERVIVAPYQQGENGAKLIFGVYSSCDLVLGNRFHANVVPIGMSVPTIGLLNYVQIENLYKSLDMEDRVVDISQTGFALALENMALSFLDSPSRLAAKDAIVLDLVNEQARATFKKIQSWFENLALT